MPSLLAVAAVAVATSIRTLTMLDPDGPLPRLNLGGEFPGAKGEVVRAEEAGVRFVRLTADLARGAYVGMDVACPMPEGSSKVRLSYRLRTANDAPQLLFRFYDKTDQCHLQMRGVKASGDWQEAEFDLGVSPAHWGKVSDGVVRLPAGGFLFGVQLRGAGGRTGSLDLRDVKLVTAAGEETLASYELRTSPGRFGALYRPDESVAIGWRIVRRSADAAVPELEMKVADWQGRELLRRRIPAAAGRGSVTLSPADLGDRVGAFLVGFGVSGGSSAATSETGFARLTTRENPKPCRWVGVGTHGSHGWGHGDFRYLDLLSAAGIGLVRDEISWAAVEQERGVYRLPENFDRLVAELHARGIRFNNLLNSGNPRYENPLDPDAFARYCAWHVKALGERCDLYEIWNEPHNFGFYREYQKRYGYGKDRDMRGDPSLPWIPHFVELSKKAAAAIRAANPKADVAVCAEDCWVLLKRMLELGIATTNEIVTIHNYDHGHYPPEGDWFNRTDGRELRETARANGGATRFATTEDGWTTYRGGTNGTYAFVGNYPPCTPEQQARYLVRMFLTGRQNGLEYISQYDFKDDGPKRSYTEHNFGIVREDYTPKPSFAALAYLTRRLGEAVPEGDAGADHAAYRLYRFREPGGRVTYVGWTVKGERKVTLPVELAGLCEIADLQGNVRKADLSSRELVLTENPVYLNRAAANLTAGEIGDGWTLACDPGNVGKTNGWAAAVRQDARPVPVPGVIQQVFPYFSGVAWYYRPVSRPAVGSDERVKIRFGAVCYYGEVYLDGRLLATHEGAESPFEVDVTEALKADSLLAVRVICPGEKEIEGFKCLTVPHRNMYEKMEFKPGWCYLTGGLSLPVTLDVVPAVRVTDAYVKSDWRTGRVTVETTVTNETDAAVSRDIRFAVRIDDLPEAVCTHVERFDVPPGGGVRRDVSFAVPGHKLWTLDTPNVYQLTADGHATRFGFRDFRLKDGWFTLNGRRIFLKSAHTGNHMPGGLAVVDPKTPELEFRDFQNMKAMGYNTIRFIATQATPRQLDYCDRLGLLVYQETYASWCLKNSPEAQRRYLESIRAELHRDRNHPSLVIWGALNEVMQEDAFQAAKGMLGEMRKIDASRLWILNSGRWDLFPAFKDVKSWPRQGDPAWPGPDWSLGSAANPGATAWENHWGDDGKLGNEKLYVARSGRGCEAECEPPYYGDLHFYPGYPHAPWAARKLREWGRGTRPTIISEYGVGSLLDVIDHLHEFERRGIRSDSPDAARMSEICGKYLADWKTLGLDRFFSDPADFLRESERMNARSRREGFDLVRSNPRCAGYNLTGALDHAICGEGPMSLFRRLKDGNFDVFRDGWSDLRWCLFLKRYNVFAGDAVEFEAVLSDFEALCDGEYKARFAIVDDDGVVKWRSDEVPFAVPQKDPDGNRAVVYPILQTAAKADFVPGKYRLRAYLDHGGYAAAFEKSFYVTARPTGAKPANFIDLGKANESAGMAAMAKVADGATALVRLDTWGAKPPRFLPLKDLKVTAREHWLYHDDTLVVPDALTKGLKVGFLDWDYFEGCFPLWGFSSETAPESVAAVNFNVGGPKVYGRTFSLATYRHGKGRLILSTLPLDPSSPAGASILANSYGVIGQ